MSNGVGLSLPSLKLKQPRLGRCQSKWPTLPVSLESQILTTVAQRCYTRAYAAADASAIQPFDFIRLPFAVFLGFIMFAEWPDLWSVIGGVIIFGSSVFVAHGETRARKKT